jgi:hypothetical protein
MRGETQTPSILIVNCVSSCLSFFLRASTAATYTFTATTCTTAIISLDPCALNAEFQHFVLSYSISYCDLIKCPYFADTTERGDRGGERRPKDRVTLPITLLSYMNIWIIEGSTTAPQTSKLDREVWMDT